MTKLIKNCFNKKHQRLLRVVTTCRILRILVPESCFNDHPIRRGFFFVESVLYVFSLYPKS